MRFFRRRWRSGPLLQDGTTNNFVLGTVSDADLYALRLETPPSTQGELNALAQATSNIKMSSIAAATFAASGVGGLSGTLRADSVGDLAAAGTSDMAAAGTTGQILYVGGTSANKVGITGTSAAISLTALTGGLAAAPIEGDIVIATYVVGSAGDTTLAVTDGTNPYTLINAEQFADGSASDANMRVAYKVMGPTPDTTVTFGPTNNAAWAGAMAVQVWRNVDTVNPIETSAAATGTASSRPDAPTITPTTTGAVVVVAGGGATPAAAALTSTLNHFQTNSGADTIDAVVGMGASYWTGGAYDPPAMGGGTVVAGDSWAAITLVIQPPALGVAALSAFAGGELVAATTAVVGAALTASVTSPGAYTGVTTKAAALSSTGLGTVLAVGEEANTGSVLAAAAVAAMAAAGSAVLSSALAAAGTGDTSVVGAAINATVLNAPTISSASYVGALTQGAVLVAAGAGSASYVTSVIAASTAAFAGVGSLAATGTALTQSVLAAAGSTTVDVRATAITQAVLAGDATGTLAVQATALMHVVLAASGVGSLAGEGGATVDIALTGTSQGEALWAGAASSDMVLLAEGSGALLARGGYGGSTNAGERRVVLDVAIRTIELGDVGTRVIYADTQVRTIYVGPEGRATQ